jgi:hypothetical protein
LSNRRSIRFDVRFIILAALAASAAAYGAYSKLSMGAYAASPSELTQAQVANRGAKADRLIASVPTSLTSAAPEPAFALASTPAATNSNNLGGGLAVTPGAPPREELLPSAAPAGPKRAVVAALPRDAAPPHQKPKHLPTVTSGILDDNQIAGLRGRLRLTPEQTEYWPAVEAALREVVRTQFRGRNLLHGKPVIDVNAPEVQKLIWAAMPLLMRLRDDQKGEVRKLARVIGLEQVASQI